MASKLFNKKNKELNKNDDLLGASGEQLETKQERRARMRSLATVHLSMLVVNLGSSIIYTGVWPYINMLDPNVRLDEYGFVVASDAFAQMLFAPVFGLISDKLKSVRAVSLFCCLLFMGGNVLYALIGLFDREIGNWTKVRMWVMIVARLIVGAGTAIASVGRTYVSTATKLSERTTHIAMLSLFQTLGFIGGPLIQALLAFIGREQELGKEGKFFLDMYTATGWFSAATGLLAFILYMPGIFQEKNIAAKEIESLKNAPSQDKEKVKKMLVKQMSTISLATLNQSERQQAKPKELIKQYSTFSVIDGGTALNPEITKIAEIESEKTKSKYPSVLLTVTATYSFFAFLFNFVLLETIVTPLAMDQWGWSQAEAIVNIGYAMAGSGAISLISFGAIGPLSKRFDERMLLMVAGLIPMIVGRLVMFPFPGAGMPPMRETNECLGGTWSSINKTCSINGTVVNSTMDTMDNPMDNFHMAVPLDFIYKSVSEGFNRSFTQREGFDMDSPFVGAADDPSKLGCAYEWCLHIPKVTVPQFMVGFFIATTGYPFCIAIMGSLYSKSLGSIPQGFWLSLLTGSGSLARVVGPIFVTLIYENYGTYLTFSLVTGSLVLSGGLILIAYKQLGAVPGAQNNQDSASSSEGTPEGRESPTPEGRESPTPEGNESPAADMPMPDPKPLPQSPPSYQETVDEN